MRHRSSRGLRSASVGCVVALGLTATTVPQPAVAATCAPSWTTAAAPTHGTRAFLSDVVAVASDDAWAVGTGGSNSGEQPLIEHWDGVAWSIVPAPSPSGALHASLQGVSAVSEDELWAVGSAYHLESGRRPLIERWNGATGRWSIVASPDVEGVLFDVVALSETDVWAVGRLDNPGPIVDDKTLIEHWDGTQWKIVPSPSLGYLSELKGIAALAPSDVWAVGYSQQALPTGGIRTRTLAEHWDGTAWTLAATTDVGTYAELHAVAAIASSDVWAVGRAHGVSGLAERWDGSGWSVMPAVFPQTDVRSTAVRWGVAAAGAGDVWAVGSDPLVAHWDGRAWSNVAVRYWDAPSQYAILRAVAAAPSGDMWAVGSRHQSPIRPHITRLCPIRVSAGGFEPASSTVAQGSDVAWSMPKTNTEDHSVSDASGMSLFDSGLRPPGSSYTATLIAAGDYRIRDRAGSNTGRIRVPLRISPRHGSQTSAFDVTWATRTASDLVFDVQLKRPSATSYADWHHGSTATSAQFTPDAGPGTYSFRARLRNTSNHRASGWSPVTVITVR